MPIAIWRRWTAAAEAVSAPAFQPLRSIDEVDAAQWNALAGTHNPFLRHEFLAALEHSGSVSAAVGWQPSHWVLRDEQGLLAALPAYLKSHSWGEFVFDQSWAQFQQRLGKPYYPKLLVAVPFSPVSGARLLVRRDHLREELAPDLALLLQQLVLANELSSAHVLFPDAVDQQVLRDAGWLLRRDCQFHWHNQGYADFEAYLATFTAEKRKKTRRERRRCEEAGISFQTLSGSDLTPDLLDVIFELHAGTFRQRGNEPYLNRAFFDEIARTLGDSMMVKLAIQNGQPVATAVFFWSGEALYGRYWGALADFHSLHFECCYHQGIEFCIERGISRFEPGTQGEHKISRGFAPQYTWSAHFLADPRLRDAVGDFLRRESEAVQAYADEVGTHTPFKRE
jgi:hypothetical protein